MFGSMEEFEDAINKSKAGEKAFTRQIYHLRAIIHPSSIHRINSKAPHVAVKGPFLFL